MTSPGSCFALRVQERCQICGPFRVASRSLAANSITVKCGDCKWPVICFGADAEFRGRRSPGPMCSKTRRARLFGHLVRLHRGLQPEQRRRIQRWGGQLRH